MDTQTNVKSIAAMFNSAPSPMETSDNLPAHGIKTNTGIQAKKAAFDKFANPTSPKSGSPSFTPKKPVNFTAASGLKPFSEETKPSFVKPNVGVSRHGGSFYAHNKDTDSRITFPKSHGLTSTEIQKEEPKELFPKPKPKIGGNNIQENRFGGVKSSFLPGQKENEEKFTFPKPSAIKTHSTVTDNEVKPPFSKKPVLTAKQSANLDASTQDNNIHKNTFMAKMHSSPQDSKPVNQIKEPAQSNDAASSSSQPFSAVKLRSTGVAQSPFIKKDQEENTGPIKNIEGKQLNKTVQDDGNSGPTTTKYPRVQSHLFTGQRTSFSEKAKERDSLEPKRKPLPPLFKLGPAPPKPARPPNVDLAKFKVGRKNESNKGAVTEQKASALSNALPPPPPSHVAAGAPTPPPPPPNSSVSAKQTSGPPLPPNLPPRNIRSATESVTGEENYDDVLIEGPSNPGEDMSLESDEEFYDWIDEESLQNKKEQAAKNEKEEKKKIEQIKKEQKEKEKKEQEIRKRFKLTGPIEVLHQGWSCVAHKGGKNELSFKEGEQIEIIRITDNPEGKWLGRIKGTYGYIKTTMVNINYDSLKRKRSTIGLPIKPETIEQEIYDDVGEQDSTSSQSMGGSGGGSFPPPPSEEDIYDGVDDEGIGSSVPQEEDKKNNWTWGLFTKRKSNDSRKKSASDNAAKEDNDESDIVLIPPVVSQEPDGDVYDDVETSDFPPPPLESTLTISTKSSTLGKSADRDSKTLKKLEKEEKEFRKKFKFNGDIKVLSITQVASTLTSKKFGSKDLPLKPGESLEVIQHTNETTLLCRNNDGKYGYVLRSNVIDNDGEIYDDIGEECVYDND
ncbi:FYN-binding protein 1 [Bombina bombina]|uniref:FYN-binding protein 1 n=1 Tax=Bombina bombina TaxID=8345 RepID=UPI00235B04D2|nr:FYN-binding protein 1 [Bombina bombina]